MYLYLYILIKLFLNLMESSLLFNYHPIIVQYFKVCLFILFIVIFIKKLYHGFKIGYHKIFHWKKEHHIFYDYLLCNVKYIVIYLFKNRKTYSIDLITCFVITIVWSLTWNTTISYFWFKFICVILHMSSVDIQILSFE